VSARTTIRLDDDLMRQLKERAKRDNISLTQLINEVIRQGLRSDAKQRKRLVERGARAQVGLGLGESISWRLAMVVPGLALGPISNSILLRGFDIELSKLVRSSWPKALGRHRGSSCKMLAMCIIGTLVLV
jgi:predicted transcriptional regulator